MVQVNIQIIVAHAQFVMVGENWFSHMITQIAADTAMELVNTQTIGARVQRVVVQAGSDQFCTIRVFRQHLKEKLDPRGKSVTAALTRWLETHRNVHRTIFERCLGMATISTCQIEMVLRVLVKNRQKVSYFLMDVPYVASRSN